MEPLVLASRSPQRSAILQQLGVDFRVHPTEVEEERGGAPRPVVIANARRKARAATGTAAGATVLGVDTVVALDGRVYGKPRDASEAEAFLRRLSARTHEVWSGVSLLDDARGERSSAAVTRVRFRALEQHHLDAYLATEEWRGRAGGYAIQARGAALVEAVEGDFWNVVGLPVAELLRLAPELVWGTPRGRSSQGA